MTADFIRTLYDYNYWARDRVLDAVERLSTEQFTKDLGSSFPSIRDTLAHMYYAEWIWHRRWNGESPTTFGGYDRFADVGSLRAEWDALKEEVTQFVTKTSDADLDKLCSYRMFNGTPGTSSFREMFLHLVNHGSYHRGQVGTMLRQLGAEPAQQTDMIAYFRSLT